MPEKFEGQNQEENQPEEEKMEKLEDIDFSERVGEVYFTIDTCGRAIIGEGLEKSDVTGNKEFFENIQTHLTPEQWSKVRAEYEKIEKNWRFNFATHAYDFMSMVGHQKKTGETKPPYKKYADALQKSFGECEYWSELNEIYKFLQQFFPEERIDHADH